MMHEVCTLWRSIDLTTWPLSFIHDDVIKWKHFPRNWPFVREIHRSPVNFPHKCQRRGALLFSLIYAWINDWVNNREAGDLRRQHGHYDVIVMNYMYIKGAKAIILPLQCWKSNHEECVKYSQDSIKELVTYPNVLQEVHFKHYLQCYITIT